MEFWAENLYTDYLGLCKLDDNIPQNDGLLVIPEVAANYFNILNGTPDIILYF